ncbi:MAG: response regulator [Prevotella sp.]|nr:response regulator [Prevotella sp.]MBQ9649146.1 response regulator [Prevotella sp.]
MKKILIAEDNDSNYILMTYILKKYYQFERAKNGKEAVEMVEKNEYDIVLMDIKMPIMDGLEATKAIKATHQELPVVALTANAFDSDRQLAMEAGCNDFLSKPVSSELCLNTIKKFIGE